MFRENKDPVIDQKLSSRSVIRKENILKPAPSEEMKQEDNIRTSQACSRKKNESEADRQWLISSSSGGRAKSARQLLSCGKQDRGAAGFVACSVTSPSPARTDWETAQERPRQRRRLLLGGSELPVAQLLSAR